MIVLRIVSGLILTFGLLLGIFGVVILRSVNRDMKLMDAMQREGMAPNIDPREFRSIIVRNAVGYIVIGGLSAISGVGLFFRQRWARLLWLGTLFFLLGLTTYQTARNLWYGGLDLASIGYLLVIAIPAGALTYYFLRGKTKAFFTDSTVAT